MMPLSQLKRSARGTERSARSLDPDATGSALPQQQQQGDIHRPFYNLPQTRPDAQLEGSCDERCWLRQCATVVDSGSSRELKGFDQQPHQYGSQVKSPLYKRLASWQTRLVVLKPGEPDVPLDCDLIETDVIDSEGFRIVNTHEIVKYEALSYSWGHPNRDCYIVCNGQSLGVPPALALALLYLRNPLNSRYIWCDAICIDQQNLGEKAIQVKNMFRIFEKADRVIAWINFTQSAQLLQACKLASDPSLHRLWYWQHHDSICFITIQKLRDMLTDLFAQPWFRRTWIRQEVYAAKAMNLQIGLEAIEFRHFLRQAYHLVDVLRIFDSSQRKISPPATLSVYIEEYQHAGVDRSEYRLDGLPTYTAYWIRTLLNGAKFEVTDERDRVFGSLGILMNHHAKFVSQAPSNVETLIDRYPVDYSKSLSDINQDISKFLINNLHSLEHLDYFTPRREISNLQKSNMPSWSRNWIHSSDQIGFHQPLEHRRPFYTKPLKQDYSRDGVLELEGLRVIKRFTLFDGHKEIGHPRDRLRPSSFQPVKFRELVNEQRQGSSAGKSNSSLRAERLAFAFVFTHMDETEFSYELRNEVVSELDPDFTQHLASDEYVFGYAEDLEDSHNLGLSNLSFLLPKTASLSDVLVSLYGSKCLHLLRPLIEGDSNSGFTYIGPVLGFVHDQAYIDKYASPTQLGAKSILKHALHAPGTRKERSTFTLK